MALFIFLKALQTISYNLFSLLCCCLSFIVIFGNINIFHTFILLSWTLSLTHPSQHLNLYLILTLTCYINVAFNYLTQPRQTVHPKSKRILHSPTTSPSHIYLMLTVTWYINVASHHGTQPRLTVHPESKPKPSFSHRITLIFALY